MELTFTQKKSIRKNFGKLKESLSIPNLIEVQKNSYKNFIESKSTDIKKDNPYDKGLLKDNYIWENIKSLSIPCLIIHVNNSNALSKIFDR